MRLATEEHERNPAGLQQNYSLAKLLALQWPDVPQPEQRRRFQRANTLAVDLLQRFPGDTDVRALTSLTKMQLARLSSRPKGTELLRAAAKLDRALVRDFPTNVERWSKLAETLSYLYQDELLVNSVEAACEVAAEMVHAAAEAVLLHPQCGSRISQLAERLRTVTASLKRHRQHAAAAELRCAVSRQLRRIPHTLVPAQAMQRLVKLVDADLVGANEAQALQAVWQREQ